MDPITIIVTALTLGAAAGLKPTAEQAIKDAYAGIKTLIKRNYEQVNVDMLESDPASEARQEILGEDLEEANAGQDAELLSQAQNVIQLVEEHAPETAAEVNIKLEKIKAAGSIRIADLLASGASSNVDVDVKKAEAGGDIEIRDIKAGNRGVSSNPKA